MNKIMCGDCDQPATWMRHTQFSGNHPFCLSCAEKEKDFNDDLSDWGKIEVRDTVTVQADSNGDLLLPLSDELLERLIWKEGDDLVMQILKDGSLSLTKITD